MLRILSFCLSLLWLGGIATAQPLGQTLPDFEFSTLSGETTKISTLRESSAKGVVMLTFWCTTCASCRSTEQSLASLARRYAHQARVVAVASSSRDSAGDIKDYLQKNELDLPVLLDTNSQLGHHLGVSRTTTTVLLDETGRVRYYGTLSRRRKMYAKAALQGLLEKGRVSQPSGPIAG